jgi:hypothetical protein
MIRPKLRPLLAATLIAFAAGLLLPPAGLADGAIAAGSRASRRAVRARDREREHISIRAPRHLAAVRVRDEEGREIGTGHATIRAPLGGRGPFRGTIRYRLRDNRSQPGRIEVYDTSARDGQLLHLSSVEVTLRPPARARARR